MQDKYIFNGYTPTRQAITVKPAFAKTSTPDSGRNQFGVADNKVMFAVQAYTVEFPTLGKTDMTGLLQSVMTYGNVEFHYFNPIDGVWKTEDFYVENISSDGIRVVEGKEKLFGLTFQITAINPV